MNEKPEGIEWLAEEEWGCVGIHERFGRCFVHCRIWRWGVSHRRASVQHWTRILEVLRARGYHEVYACQKLGDRTLAHFHQLFGFVTEVDQKRGFRLIKQEI